MPLTDTIQPSKRLGQHLLIDPRYCQRIVRLAAVESRDRVIEVGPGTGRLTEVLLRWAAHVVAVEFDRAMIQSLQKRWPNRASGRLTLVEADILRLDWNTILNSTPVKIVGNLPYNISTRIIRRMIEIKQRFQSGTLMVQKEVGERILAEPGCKEYGAFSVLMAFHFRRRRGFDVPPGAFFPRPRVQSSVIQILPQDQPLAVVDPTRFENLVEVAFGQRRKTLRNNLKTLGLETGCLDRALRECGISPRVRPEEVDLAAYACLSQML